MSDAKSIMSSYLDSCVPKPDIPHFIALHQRGKLPVQKPRMGYIGFDEINAGFDHLSNGSVLRQALRSHA